MILSLRKMTTLSIVVILVSATVAWGLKEMTYAETPTTMQVEESVGPIKLTMSLEKVTYKLGENVNVTLQIENVSNTTITLGYLSHPKVDFVVYSEPSGIWYAYANEHGFAGYARNTTLEPGELFGRTLKWDQKARPSPGDYHRPLEQVTPGTYFVFGRLGFGLYAVEPSEQEIQEFKQMETPRIQIQISA